jgi:hypothetical protein
MAILLFPIMVAPDAVSQEVAFLMLDPRVVFALHFSGHRSPRSPSEFKALESHKI